MEGRSPNMLQRWLDALSPTPQRTAPLNRTTNPFATMDRLGPLRSLPPPSRDRMARRSEARKGLPELVRLSPSGPSQLRRAPRRSRCGQNDRESKATGSEDTLRSVMRRTGAVAFTVGRELAPLCCRRRPCTARCSTPAPQHPSTPAPQHPGSATKFRPCRRLFQQPARDRRRRSRLSGPPVAQAGVSLFGLARTASHWLGLGQAGLEVFLPFSAVT